ncbi:MAG: helicase-associated domain-containing protein [Anaeromyxobacter sp.]
MPHFTESHARYFREETPVRELARELLGEWVPSPILAARALAELVADLPRLQALVTTFPGAGVVALEVLSGEEELDRRDLVVRLEARLGPGRAEAALHAVGRRGLLAQQRGWHGHLVCKLWEPFREALRSVFAAGALAGAPEEGAAWPDQGGLALAVLLAQLEKAPLRISRNDSPNRRDLEVLERRFERALGDGVTTHVVRAFRRIGLLAHEVRDAQPRASLFAVVDQGAALGFLEGTRAQRLRALCAAWPPPRALRPLFQAGARVLPLEHCRRLGGPCGVEEQTAWLEFGLATGLLEEVGGGVRVAGELRGQRPQRPAAGRWLVQPTLEIVVPPDVPPGDVFRLARLAEVESLDRAAVLRLTPRSLDAACGAGFDEHDAIQLLTARAGAPLPETVLRVLADGLRSPRMARLHHGLVAVVPGGPAATLRAHPELPRLAPREPAPGVFLVEPGQEEAFKKVLAATGAEARCEGRRTPTFWPQQLDACDTAELEILLALPALPDPDPRIAQARQRALDGHAGEFPEVPPAAPAAKVDAGAEVDGEELGFEDPEEDAAERELDEEEVEAVLDVEQGQEAPPALRDMFAQWAPVARRAIARRHDLWLLLDGAPPRRVTPHRFGLSGGRLQLEALAQDTLELRAFPADLIRAAALSGPSRPRFLTALTEARGVLRASRNDPCPCGSQRKYKACCLTRDVADELGT